MATSARGPLDVVVKICLVLAIIGALNWGLVGFFNWNLVAAIFSGDGRAQAEGFSRVVYAVVGVAGLLSVFLLDWRVPLGRESGRIERRIHA